MVSPRRRVGCCGGVRVGKSIVRNASKTTERQIVDHAKALYNDPYVILPSFQDDSCKKRFKKIIKQIQKVEKVKDKQDKLEKLSNKRNIGGAIAGTLLIHHAKKAPFLAASPMAGGSVLFAIRGNAQREHLIAVQHFDDPFLRLLAIREVVIENNLYVYSWDEGYVCTGNRPDPPDEFIRFVMNKHGLTYKDQYAYCSHLKKDIVAKKKKSKHPYLLIEWKSAPVTIGICSQCAKKTANFLFETTKYLIEPDISDDFSFEVIGSIIKDEQDNITSDTEFLDDYFSGKLSDKQMIEKNMNERLKDLKDSSEQRFILNEKSYDSADEFIEALQPNEYERQALDFLLEKSNESIVVSDATPNSVIEQLWDDYGRQFLEEIVHDKTRAEDLFQLSDSPSKIIKTAFDLQKRMQIINELPSYANLPSLARFVDQLARTYRIEGKEKMVIEIKKQSEGAKEKAISYGFLLAINKDKDLKWKYKKEEIESGEFLKPYIETLLRCPPDEYHHAFQELLTYSGASIDLTSYQQ
jgi:hypothetical protein